MTLAREDPILQLLRQGAQPLTPDARGLELRSRVSEHIRNQRFVLAALPEAALVLVAVSAEEDIPIRDAVDLVQKSPTVAARVRLLLEAPRFEPLSGLRSLRAVAVRAGLLELRDAVVATSLRAEVFDAPGFRAEADAAWRHTLAVACAGRELAARSKALDPHRAFLAGLVHGVGYGVVLKAAAQVCRQHLPLVPDLEPHVRTVAEALRGYAATFTARRWRLDGDLVAALEPAPGTATALGRTLSAAHAAAVAAGLSPWPAGATLAGRPGLVGLPDAADLPADIVSSLPDRIKAYAVLD